jgi:hypothetical protein
MARQFRGGHPLPAAFSRQCTPAEGADVLAWLITLNL